MINFHGKYALPLETIARDALYIEERESCGDMDADQIESGGFVETMQKLLYMKHGLCKEFSHFCAESDQYWGTTGFDFSESDAERLYGLFKIYYDRD